ncbi:sigma-70 family RNA polymerase sigma factor [Paenibacillus sp. JX-17]|uniref:RNA polymerase sigma factor n=1 Tax=Paenibacillus lacisoli TaxID=3064525 RepID=A0ABT9CF53_9BACL|nr:sigma-70 family RNA polymerase sigma factor [Paenibacillus sp. JX-17]MDO7907269.1 sigma-70 family RNA polymerase sigma factor [Paenibacillus sp. JX-17]
MEEQAQQDEAALREWMNRYGDHLLRTAVMLLKDYQTAEEVVQDTFVQAFRKADQLKEPSRLKSWLTAITVNGCRMRQRRWSWKYIFPSEIGNTENPADERQGPESRLLAASRNEELKRAVQKLSYNYRETVVLYYYNEYSVEEITELLGCSTNTIKSRLRRGRAKLRELWEKEEQEFERRQTAPKQL